MAEPMTDERLAEIQGLLDNTVSGYTWVVNAHSAMGELLAEVKRLNRNADAHLAWKVRVEDAERERDEARAAYGRIADAIVAAEDFDPLGEVVQEIRAALAAASTHRTDTTTSVGN